MAEQQGPGRNYERFEQPPIVIGPLNENRRRDLRSAIPSPPDQQTGFTGTVTGTGYEGVRRLFGENPDPNAYGSHVQQNVDALVMPSGEVFVNMASRNDVPPFNYRKVDLGTKGQTTDGEPTTVSPERAALMDVRNIAIFSTVNSREITNNQKWALQSMVPWNANLASAGAAAAGTNLATSQVSPTGNKILNSRLGGY